METKPNQNPPEPESTMADPGIDATVRCFGCLNRVGFSMVKVVQGIPICPRCEGRREVLVSPQGYEIEIVG